MTIRIYLAGPDVFRTDAEEHGRVLLDACDRAGFKGLYPCDNVIIPDSRSSIAEQIFNANREMLDQADAIIANISPFRGPNMDPGTAWEIGYAAECGIPIWVYSDRASTTLLTRTSAADIKRSPAYTLVEHFELNENLMISASAYETTRSSFSEALNDAVRFFFNACEVPK